MIGYRLYCAMIIRVGNEQLRIRAQFVITLALSRFKAHLKMLNIKI